MARLRHSLDRSLVLTEVARWDPDKRWIMAVETVAALRARGHDGEEAAWYVRYLKGTQAPRTARRFVWDRVVDNLRGKVEFLAVRQGMG